MRQLQDDVTEPWKAFDAEWQNFSSNIKALRLPEDASFSLDLAEGQEGLSYPDISQKVSQCRDYVDALQSSKNFHSIPVRSINKITSLTDEAKAQLADANAKFEQAENSNGFSKFDNQSFMLSSADDVTKIDLSALYRAVFEKLDNFVFEYSIISHFLKVEGTSGFYFKKQEVDRILSQIEKDSHSVSAIRDQLTDARKIQRELIQQFQEELDTIEATKQSVTDNATKVEEALNALDTKIEDTNSAVENSQETITQAEALKADIDAHQKFITDNQELLDTLREDIDKEYIILNELEEKYRSDAGKIAKQIQDAEDMLQGATVAGLASEFGTIKSNLENDLKDARNAVHWSAGFLFISVLPIMLYVFGPSFGLPMNGVNFGEGNLVQSITGLAMRAVLLIPATWFARFSAKRYDRIFKLKEHYSYKYSLATAVEGFKKQAPEYEDDIAAETFYELTFNPADKLDQPRGRTIRRKSIVLDAMRKRLKRKTEEPEIVQAETST